MKNLVSLTFHAAQGPVLGIPAGRSAAEYLGGHARGEVAFLVGDHPHPRVLARKGAG